MKEVICSYILRNSLDLVVFSGKSLHECKDDFNEILSELEDPNIPKIKLTSDRGKWKVVPLYSKGLFFPIYRCYKDRFLGKGDTASLIALNLEKIILSEESEEVLRIQLSTFFTHQHELTLSHSTSSSPSLLISKNHISPTTSKSGQTAYSDTGVIKISSSLLSSKFSPNGPKYESNLENLKSSYIPASPSSPVGRITTLKPEYLELNLI